MAPGHPNLLPARFTDDASGVGPAFARKPLRSREGANVTLFQDGPRVEATGGAYGDTTVDQALAPLPSFDR